MLALLLWWLIGLAAAELPPELAEIEDPRRLEALAESARDAGDLARATELYGAMFEREELRRYLKFTPDLAEALVLERLGQHARAAELYRAGMKSDVLRVIQALRIVSVHPERDTLVAEAVAHVEDLAARAARGEKATIYVTSTGILRPLEPMTTAQVLANARKGEPSKYCWVEKLDLRGQDLTGIEHILLDRCVVGAIDATHPEVPKFTFKGIVLGAANFGKTWNGAKNTSISRDPGRFGDLVLRESVFLGLANFASVAVTDEGRAYFPLTVFDGPVDFAGAEFDGIAEFRFSTFGAGANFRRMQVRGDTLFAHARFRGDVAFSGVIAQRPVVFASARFDAASGFDGCEWFDLATFEDARFAGPASFASSRVPNKRLNLSRARFEQGVTFEEMHLDGLDAFGTWFGGRAVFTETTIAGRARFAVDRVTRETFASSPDGLRVLYRDYQGDEDAEAPLTTKNSYGVVDADDLTARMDGDVSFANTAFLAYTVFEGVTFGTGPEHVASFYNAQFVGETHFERTVWNARADLRTIFAKEVAFNEATFAGALVLDDAFVDGRVTLTDAQFAPGATWSFYGAAIREFQLSTEHVDAEDGGHRLFYERCALGRADLGDPRIADLDDEEREAVCYDRLLDELVGLKEAYGAEAMIEAEDDAYWWFKHHETMATLRHGSALEKLRAATIDLVLFELCFGWGVKLGNLGVAVLVITAMFATLYRFFCVNTVLSYDGEEMPISQVSFVGLFFVSLQTLMAINTGWDFGDDDHRFRYLNTMEALIGYIILTFFVGAYTRMILA